MVGLGAAPAVAQFGILVFLPETPRWLVKAGKTEQARAVLRKVYGKGLSSVVESVIRDIDREITEEEEATSKRRNHIAPTKDEWPWLTLLQDGSAELFGVGGNRRALTIACLLQGLQQLCGFVRESSLAFGIGTDRNQNSLMYFSATIFALVGFSSPTLASLSIAVTNFGVTIVSLVLIDRVGRRRILLYSIPIMVIGLILCAVAFYFLDVTANQGEVVGITTAGRHSFWAMSILITMVLYVSGYAIGLGSVPWMQSELFPLSIRSLGSGLATATNWGSNFVVGLTFLPMMQFMTPVWTFVVYGLVCAAGWICVWTIYPETKGLGLEEVGGLLKDGWGVQKSLDRVRTDRG